MKLVVLFWEIEENLNKGLWICKLFDEGVRLKKEFGDDQVFDFLFGNLIVELFEVFKRVLIEEVEKGNYGYI